MKQVTISVCTQCKHFNHKLNLPVCFGLGFRARLPYQRIKYPEAYYIRATGKIPNWCSLEDV